MNIIHSRRASRANEVRRRPFKIAALVKVLGCLLALVVFGPMVRAANVDLAWSPSTAPLVAGYNLYYGGASGVYTNEVSAGNATNATISGLIPGTAYFFAATAYSASGLESTFSSEVLITVPMPTPGVQLQITPAKQFVLTVSGQVGHTYNILATQDLQTWKVIGTVTVGAGGSSNFTDTNAAGFSRRFYRTQG
jgi:hypothetical protein